jgi:hypothetical protein
VGRTQEGVMCLSVCRVIAERSVLPHAHACRLL